MHFQRIHIELTNSCNFSCEFCPDSLMTRERGRIDFTLLCKALDEISQEKLTEQVLFHVMGEPTLYPKLNMAVEYAKSKGLGVHLTTNGLAMTEDMLGELLEAKIEHILFSVQTPDKKSFGLRRANIGFEGYKKHISLLIARALERKGNTSITLSFLTTPFKKIILPTKEFSIIDNRESLIKHVNSWLNAILLEFTDRDLKNKISANINRLQDRLSGLSMLGWNKLKISDNLFLETRVLGDWIHRSLLAKHVHKATIGCCEGLTRHFGILWNGDMVFCCVDFNGNTKFNNIRNSSIKEALQEKDVKNYINEFNRLRIRHPYCQRCLGDSSFLNAFVRQVGSIIYFKYFRKHWTKRWKKEESLVY